MKNSLNFVVAILIFVVLGCACPRLDKLTGGGPPPAPDPPPGRPTNSTSPGNRSTVPANADGLTMAKYNQLKNEMSKSEVERILGGPGEEVSSSTGGGVTFSVYKWSGENYTSVIVTFRDNKLMTKAQVGLK